ncbi:acyltransferase family protein [Salinicola rhizosphaerae]|uniref:Acyltransferase n=1 Tax=Salinicola rhizosphaerae TaxID=1443141 RepID=A0ABQ3E7R6_9GAMM|nr:acyltransferase [Salinicola rhizosphaerae]GHB27777.1 acyltransferase [Salinicola rhizosphaerae]
MPETTATPKVAKERFIGLEWLRFLLGLYIVIFHTLHNYPSIREWSHYVTDIGFFSTSAFFVLSGFLLTHVYLDEQYRLRESPKSFWLKRFSNLYPIHIGSLVLAMAVSALVGYLAIAPGDSDISLRFVVYDVNNDVGQLNWQSLNHTMSPLETGINVLLNLTLLHAWNPLYLTFNPPSWSISALFFFYLTFPWLAPRLRRVLHPRRAILLVNLIYLVPPLYVILTTDYGVPETGILHRNPLIRLPEFAAGILLYTFYALRKSQGRMMSRGQRYVALAIIAVAVVIAVKLLGLGHAWYYALHNGLLLPFQLALVYVAAQWGEPRSQKLKRWAARLGGASLPMFALHVPLYAVFSRVERVLSGNPGLCATDFSGCLAAAGELHLWLYPVFLLLTVAFCVLFQEQFVVRVRKFLLRHLLRRSPDDHVANLSRSQR